jgi:dTDP-4-amino-4,6-dideoxygalactose transaminase
MTRLYLSPPHMSGEELPLVVEAFKSNWIAPLGPHVDALEREFASAVGVGHAAALSSGTAALHLAVRLAGVKRGDEVLCSTLTFVASANPITYEGGIPVFIDSERRSWNMDPVLLAEELDRLRRQGRLPRAVILAHLYGQSADLTPIVEACARHGVVLIEDAAEALGATYQGVSPGSRGRMGVFSFNGNKIITASAGGMLVSNDADLIADARFLATQARDDAPYYQHSCTGFNYRLSNILAAIARGQLRVLEDRVRRRRQNAEFYRVALETVPGIRLMPEAPFGVPTRWLTVVEIDEEEFGLSPEELRRELESRDIESRPLWKPLHLQPLFKNCRVVGGAVAEELFTRGLCLPSGSQMTAGDLERVVDAIVQIRQRRVLGPSVVRRAS